MEINVAGTTFKTWKSTLTDARFFDDYTNGTLIDRDPDSFKIILNFLRGTTNVLPTDPYVVSLLKSDAEYYRIESLKRYLQDQEILNEDKGITIEQMKLEIRELMYELWVFEKQGNYVEKVDASDISQCQDKMKCYECLLKLRTSYVRVRAHGESHQKAKVIRSMLEIFSKLLESYFAIKTGDLREYLDGPLKDDWEEARKNYEKDLFEHMKPQKDRKEKAPLVDIYKHFGPVLMNLCSMMILAHMSKHQSSDSTESESKRLHFPDITHHDCRPDDL